MLCKSSENHEHLKTKNMTLSKHSFVECFKFIVNIHVFLLQYFKEILIHPDLQGTLLKLGACLMVLFVTVRKLTDIDMVPTAPVGQEFSVTLAYQMTWFLTFSDSLSSLHRY